MKRESISSYFHFGTCVRYLQDCHGGLPVKGVGFVLQNIDAFLNTLDTLALRVTRNASIELVTFKHNLENNADENSVLSEEDAKKLTNIMQDIRKTLNPELADYYAFIVTPKILDTEKLLNDVSALFRPSVFSALPVIAQYDLTEAGKCIAFERPTAAAFHLLRSTESVLRQFYFQLVRRNRVASLLWGPVVDDLRRRPTTKKYTMLYNNLDNIRHSYRNPTQHPDKIYDINEIQDLWPICIEVINRMTTILQEHRPPESKSTRLLAVLASRFHKLQELPAETKISLLSIDAQLPWLQTALGTHGISVVPIFIIKNELLLALRKGVIEAVLVSKHPLAELQDSIASNEIRLISCSKPALDAVIKNFPTTVRLSVLPPRTYTGQSQKFKGYIPY